MDDVGSAEDEGGGGLTVEGDGDGFDTGRD